MSLADAFRYDGKRVLVVGGATGMGRAAAELAIDLGAEVTVMDRAAVDLPDVASVHVDLSDKGSIDAAIGELAGEFHALLSCAGVADGTPGIERINFLGHRHMIDAMVAGGMLPRGSAIGFISSAAGLGWEANYENIVGALETPDFDSGVEWFAANMKADYYHTKQILCAYVSREAFPFLRKGIRVNAICPGPTDTPLAQANAELWLSFGADFREELGVDASTPMDQAYPLLFLCSDAARAIAGITLISDLGYISAGMTNAFPPAAEMAHMLTGR